MDSSDLSLAVVAMSGRFPGAKNLAAFWSNLRSGVESIRSLTDAELASSRVQRDLLQRPDYVRAGSFLDDVELFDAGFFGFAPREAELMDPQHRLFMECAWEALEIGGYATGDRPPIGVFASCSTSGYLLNNLYSDEQLVPSVLGLQMLVGNDKDYLATHVSYKLNLRGPSMCVQSACSSSLVAVHLAAQSLLNRECDAALAGGVTVKVPQNTGYLHQDGLILSPDARTYTFDERGRGTVFGSGVGVVLLKRLDDAIADRDTILAVIRGSAINNDGSAKVGFTAPSVDGQASVIAEALAVAGVDAESISYVEAHGTGTPLGDPIEIAALTQAYRATTSRSGYCAIGSVKTNVGHLESAAGIAGFIKTVLSLSNGEIPASLNYERPNRQIDFAKTPFAVNRELKQWNAGAGPRRAGVSSFGFGGTNCHVILEEAPSVPRAHAIRGAAALRLQISARTPAALRALATSYREALPALSATASLDDICYTAGHRRVQFDHQVALTGRSFDDMQRGLDRFLAGDVVDDAGQVPANGRCVPLPSYPFERQRWWVEPRRTTTAVARDASHEHPLLQEPADVADHPGTRYWNSTLDDERLSFLADHVVGGQPVFPASGSIEAALAAGRKVFGNSSVGLDEISFHRLLPLTPGRRIQVSTGIDDGTFRLHSRADEPAWTLHASAKIARSQPTIARTMPLGEIRARCQVELDVDGYYAGLAAWGLAYGREFRGIEEIRRGEGEALARLRVRKDGVFHAHPALLDAAFQVMGAVLHAEGSKPRTFVPVAAAGVKLASSLAVDEVHAHVVLRAGSIDSDEIECAVTIADGEGRVLLSIDAVRARSIDTGVQPAATLLYRLAWEEQPLTSPARVLSATSWLIAGTHAGLHERLTAAGAVCEMVNSSNLIPQGQWKGVIYVAGTHEQSCGELLGLAQAITARGGIDELWVVTRGAQWIDGRGSEASLGNAGLWGLSRAIALEHPELRCVRVDLDPDLLSDDLLFAEVASSADEDQIAFRDGKRVVARLDRVAEVESPAVRVEGDATYLVTGGLGSLGLHVAAWLVDRGARNLVLAGRNAGATDSTRALEARGARVVVRAIDVGSEADVRELIADIDATMPKLRGIIHAAGVLEDALLSELSADRLARAMRPKLAGALALHRATLDRELDFFVMFSSATAILGSPGQASYAAANAAMDAVAHLRRSRNLPAVSINWGPWAEGGMAAAAGAAAHRRWSSRGITPLPAARALEILGSIGAATRDAQLVAMDLDWEAMFAQLGTVPPLLSRMKSQTAPPVADSSFVRELIAAPERARKQLLEDHLLTEAAKLLGVSREQLDPRRPLNDLGLDSLMAIELRSVLVKNFGKKVPATLLFDYPTIDALVTYLLAELVPQVTVVEENIVHDEELRRVSELSEEEAEELLLQRLNAIGQ